MITHYAVTNVVKMSGFAVVHKNAIFYFCAVTYDRIVSNYGVASNVSSLSDIAMVAYDGGPFNDSSWFQQSAFTDVYS